MKHIKSYDNYKRERIIQENFNQKLMILNGVELDGSDEDLFKRVFEKVLSHYPSDIKVEIENYLLETNLLTEGFFDKLKERFPKAAEVSKVLSDKAEAALGSILTKCKDAVSFVKKINEGIRDFFNQMVERGKTFFMEQIKSGKLKQKIEELTKTNKSGLISDLKSLKPVISFYKGGFMDKLLGNTEKGVVDFMNSDLEPVAESLVLEGANVIATLVHKIESIPPFSWLEKIAKSGEAGANQLISALSDLTKKLGGPEFKLPVIALLIGIVIEQFVKNQAGHWLLDLAGSTTPFGIAIKGLKMVAFTVSLIVALDATIGTQLLGHGDHGDHNKEHTDDKKVDNKPEDDIKEQE